MTMKNETQLNYLYGQETVEVLKKAMTSAIKEGNYVTINIDDLDKLTDTHVSIAKVKLAIKNFFRRFVR